MSKYVRLFFNRKKKATETVAGAIEIVVCFQRERCYSQKEMVCELHKRNLRVRSDSNSSL